MSTIKDVARVAGVSATTVSIILNGKARERKIPVSTQERVLNAAKAVGYQPDMGARRLRRGGNNKPVIVFFWPLDYRLPILSSFINAITKELLRQGTECELLVQTFVNDRLEEFTHSLRDNYYSAVMIGACSARDLEHLESLKLNAPVILINRNSQLYSCAGVDNLLIGRTAAEMIAQKGYRQAVLVAAKERYLQTRRRTGAFLERAGELGITIAPEHILRVTGDLEGGTEAARLYLALEARPKVIFCESDPMALGVINTFHHLGVRVPEDVEVLAVSITGDRGAQYSVPSLSTIELPNEEIAKEAVHILLEQLGKPFPQPEIRLVDAPVVLRDSFRLPDEE